ncbi:MAG: XRE family transcriptional regulator [Chloroflexi bacterium]|nr:XRE family transcriptional regulator [Chloroflexota bacterium]
MNEQITARLQSLRKSAGLSQAELGQAVGASTSLISRWESGEREPSSTQVLALARALGVSVDYLLNARTDARFILRGAKPGDPEIAGAVAAAMRDAQQQIHYLDAAWRLAGLHPQRYATQHDATAIGIAGIEDFAVEMRSSLQLNTYVSLDELKQALRARHVHVFEWHLPMNLSGMSYRGAFTVIFINRSQPQERRLFTLAHELAHLLLHSAAHAEAGGVSLFSSRRDPMEKVANKFAAELLMPRQHVDEARRTVGERLRGIEELDAFAHMYNVSRDAMFYRLVDLGFFQWTEKSHYFATGRVADENQPPHRIDDIPEQTSPEFLRVALSLLEAERISTGKLTEWLFSTRDVVERFLAGMRLEQDIYIDESDEIASPIAL